MLNSIIVKLFGTSGYCHHIIESGCVSNELLVRSIIFCIESLTILEDFDKTQFIEGLLRNEAYLSYIENNDNDHFNFLRVSLEQLWITTIEIKREAK